jgi:hypothetical protein
MRDCTCEKPGCRLCWLYHNDPAYRRYWDTAPEQKPVTTFLQAMGAEVAWRAAGHSGPRPEEKTVRRRLCDACQYHDSGTGSCTQCGCYLEAHLIPPIPFGKLDCATQRCPIGLWNYTGGYEGPKCGGCGSK